MERNRYYLLHTLTTALMLMALLWALPQQAAAQEDPVSIRSAIEAGIVPPVASQQGARVPEHVGVAGKTAALLIDQQPNQNNGFFSDSDCNICGTGQQSLADNFALTTTETISQIIFWGGFFPSNIATPDNITVIFHPDIGGIPGAPISTQTNVPSARVQTGVILFGVNEYLYTLTLAAPVTLGPGNYFVEIFNDTSGNPDSFFWESGNLDVVNGIPFCAFSQTTPGSTWFATGCAPRWPSSLLAAVRNRTSP